MMDCRDVTVPSGHHGREGGKYKACVLTSYRDGCIYPLLCLFGDEHASDLTLGRQMMQALLELLPRRNWTLLLDRGLIDGKWIGELQRRGVNVVIGVRSDMHLYDDALGLARLEELRHEYLPHTQKSLHNPKPMLLGSIQICVYGSRRRTTSPAFSRPPMGGRGRGAVAGRGSFSEPRRLR